MGFSIDAASNSSQKADTTDTRAKVSWSYLDSAQKLFYTCFRLLTGGSLAQRLVALREKTGAGRDFTSGFSGWGGVAQAKLRVFTCSSVGKGSCG